MSKHRPLDDNEHVVRQCPRKKQARDEHGNILGVDPSFFELNAERNENYLSCTWFEFFSGTDADRLNAIYEHLKKKLKGKGRWKEAMLAKSNVGKLKAAAEKKSRDLSIRFTPSKEDPAYSKISGLPLDNSDRSLLDALANEEVATTLFPLPETDKDADDLTTGTMGAA